MATTRKTFNWSVKNTIMQDAETKEKLSALSNISFKYSTKPIEGCFSCVKLTIGKKYYIAKVKTIQWLELHFNKVLKAYNMGGTNDMYLPIVKRIHDTGYYDVQVDFICQDTNPYNVIKAEYKALQSAKDDKMCMNESFEPYLPKWNEKTKQFGWLTTNQFLNYKKYVNKSQNSI